MATVKKCQHLLAAVQLVCQRSFRPRPISMVTMKMEQQNDLLSCVPPVLLDIRDYHKYNMINPKFSVSYLLPVRF